MCSADTSFCLLSDTGSYEFIPHQVLGVFIGWANIEMHGIYKVVVCIGWDTSSGAAKRVIVSLYG